MFKLEFDPANKPLAAAIGAALVSYGTGATFSAELTTTIETVGISAAEAEKNVNEALTELNTAGNSSETPDKLDSTTTETATSAAAGNDATKLDEKGVGFNVEYCSKAQIPFYQSGKMQGQWKKRQGVEQSAYDSWYEDSLASASPATGNSTSEETPVDTGAAFGNQQAPAAGGLTFADAGQFMAWVAEQQTAELLTQSDIDSAYQMTSTQVHDLFNPQLFPAAVKAVYEFLAPIAAGQA